MCKKTEGLPFLVFGKSSVEKTTWVKFRNGLRWQSEKWERKDWMWLLR